MFTISALSPCLEKANRVTLSDKKERVTTANISVMAKQRILGLQLAALNHVYCPLSFVPFIFTCQKRKSGPFY